MGKPTGDCAILRPDSSRADFEAAIRELGYIHFETRPGDGDRAAYEQVWAWPSLDAPTSGVWYVEDPMSNLRYITIRAGSRPDVARQLTERLALYTHHDLLRDALEATEHNDQVRAINRLAIGTPACDPAVVTVIRLFATQAQNPLLREAAVNAMGFRAWPDYRPWLEHIATNDPAENVRRHAANLLAHWPAT